MSEIEQSIPTNEAEADSLLDGVDAPDSAAIGDEKPQTPSQEFSFTANGKEIKIDLAKDRDKLMRWAQMGHEHPERIGKLSKEIEQYKAQAAQWNTIKDKYEPVDQYVRQNPKFWDHVMETYKNRNQALNDPTNPLASSVNQMQEQINGLMKYKDQIE